MILKRLLKLSIQVGFIHHSPKRIKDQCMALLLQCLRELRARHGDNDKFFQVSPVLTRGRDTCVSFADQAQAFQADALTNQADPSCSEPRSNPGSTASQ